MLGDSARGVRGALRSPYRNHQRHAAHSSARGFAAVTSATTPALIAGGRVGHAATNAANSGSVGWAGAGLVVEGVESLESAPQFAPLCSPALKSAVFSDGVRVLYRPLSRFGTCRRFRRGLSGLPSNLAIFGPSAPAAALHARPGLSGNSPFEDSQPPFAPLRVKLECRVFLLAHFARWC